jgi:hypothetical protein
VRCDDPQTALFGQSGVGFTGSEVRIVERAAGDPASGAAYRGPSRLQLLQQAASPPRPSAAPPLSHIQSSIAVSIGEPSDPIVSLTRPDEAEDAADAAHARAGPTDDDCRAPSAVTIAEIRDNVWAHAHRRHPRGDTAIAARPIDGAIEEDAISLRESRGRKKVTQIVAQYSAVEKSGRSTPENPGTEDRAQELERCYSALRYRKYVFRNHGKVPDFIDNCDFQALQEERRAEKEQQRLKRLAEATSKSGSRGSIA